MRNKIVLLSKDAMGKSYLPTYGNTYWKTPHIDELAQKGTVFLNHFTASPSSAMAYLSMFTGEYAHETNKKNYLPVYEAYSGPTLFDKAADLGYHCHIIWDTIWMSTSKRHSECFGKETTIHPMDDLRQGVGAHYLHEGFLKPNDSLASKTLERLEWLIKEICESNSRIFLWLHLPHVINGRVSYGSDIDLFDECVRILGKYFTDDSIYISSDHGNMNGEKNKICYGFDVYNAAVCIPLITPRINNLKYCNVNTSTVDLFDLIFNQKIIEREFIYSDTAYYAQLSRKLAIIYKNYKYIYNKNNKTEELYDLEFDPQENCNIINDYIYDVDRHISSPLRELYFYPHWDEIEEIRLKMREEKNRIWRNENVWEHLMAVTESILTPLKNKAVVFKRKLFSRFMN